VQTRNRDWVGDQALAEGDFAGHLDEHEPDIRAWLAGQRGGTNAPTARAPYSTTTDDTS